jgi:uncharacterized membrane protein YkoI
MGDHLSMRVLTSMRALVALILLAGLCASAQAQRWSADAVGPQNYAPRSTAAERRVSLAQAVAIVQRATGGKVLDAKDLGGQYRIKVLTRSGEVRVVYVDAQTGAMRD